MKCPNCGRENEKDAKFCAVCGASMEKTEEQKEALNNGKKKKNRRRILIVISGVLVVVAVIAAGVWIIRGKQVKKQYDQNLASGQKYLEELNYESAEDSYLKAIQIDPKEPEPYRKLIDTYVAQEKYDDAVKIARKAQKQVPKEEKKEFEKVEQEYDSVIDYEWVVDPTIEADDIYYAVSRDYRTYSPNELLKQEDEYAIIQKDGAYGLIDIQGEMNGGMEYKNIYNTSLGYILERIEPRYISEISYEAEQDILWRTTKEITYLEGIGGDGGEYGLFYWCQNKLQNTNERTSDPTLSPIRILNSAIPVQEYNEPLEYGIWRELWDETENKSYAICKDGNLKTDFVYDHLGSVSDGVMAAEKDGKWGYINEEGEVVIPFEYDASWEKGFSFIEPEIGNTEPEETPFCYAASEGFIPLVKNKQWKLVNTEGETAIPCGIFESIRPVYDGKCWVEKNGKWGVIKVAQETGKELKNKIVGVWRNNVEKTGDAASDFSAMYTSEYSTEFRSDGTVECTGYRNIDTGTYEIVGENTIQATFDKNYFEGAAQGKELIDGYSYTVLYTYDEDKNTLYAEYDQTFTESGNSNASSGELTR